QLYTLTGAPLHLHDMGYDVNGSRMSRVKRKGASGRFFGTTVLPGFLEGERVHREEARIAGHRGIPFGQHLGDAIPHHAPPPEAEIQRMRDHERENVTLPVDDDGAVAFDRKRRVTLEPSPRRSRMATRVVVQF